MNSEELEKKLDEALAKVDQRLDEIGRKLEERFSSLPKAPAEARPQRRETPFWGVALLVVGVILLANRLDWFDWHIPLFPVALLVIGLFLLIENR